MQRLTEKKQVPSGKALFALTLLMATASGCFVTNQDDAIVLGAGYEGTASLLGFIRTVYPQVRVNCSSCHGIGTEPRFALPDVNQAFMEVLPQVNFADIPESILVRRVKDGHCGGACSTDGSEMIRLISEWKTLVDSNNGEVLPGAVVPKGNIFTKAMPIPAPKAGCSLPADLRCSPDITEDTALACANRCWNKLRFPLKDMTPQPPTELHRAWFEVDIAYENYASALGRAAYVVRNARLISPDKSIYVFDIKLFLNGQYKPEYGQVYRMVDTVVPPAKFGEGCTVPAAPTPFNPSSIGASCVPMTQALFSTAANAAAIIQERTDQADEIGFSFEYLQTGNPSNCANLNMFLQNVYEPIRINAIACLDCHKNGGNISEAGKRFNMDITDLSNGATEQLRKEEVCRRFLQRSNLALPSSSPIIVQPKQGLNGMPAQPNFNHFSPDWIDWIEAEAAASRR